MSSRLLVVRVHGITSIVVTTGVSGAFVPRRLVRRGRVLVPWLTYLLTDLREQPRSPPVLYVDNKAMLALCREHRLEHRTKHIALRYFLARELEQRGQLRLAYVASEANTADIFTKALAPGAHQRFCTLLACFALLDWSCDLLFSYLYPTHFASSFIPVSSQSHATQQFAHGVLESSVHPFCHALLLMGVGKQDESLDASFCEVLPEPLGLIFPPFDRLEAFQLCSSFSFCHM
ncbi:unnamed protein product [Closterium sp. NIES-53]